MYGAHGRKAEKIASVPLDFVVLDSLAYATSMRYLTLSDYMIYTIEDSKYL